MATSAAGEMNGQFSPDGAWIAYESDESGEREAHVRPFERSANTSVISTQGGRYARWRRDGTERYCYASDGWLMAALRRSSDGRIVAGDPASFAVALRLGGGQLHPVPGVGRRPALPGQCRDRRRFRGAHADPQPAPRHDRVSRHTATDITTYTGQVHTFCPTGRRAPTSHKGDSVNLLPLIPSILQTTEIATGHSVYQLLSMVLLGYRQRPLPKSR